MILNIHNYIDNLEEFYSKVKNIAKIGEKNKLICFYGQPDQTVMDIFYESGYNFLDLDIDYKSPNLKIVPEVYCHIIKDVVNNVFNLKKKIYIVICTTGADKCDQGRNVRDILEMEGFDLIDASNICKEPVRPLLISTAGGSLKKRVSRIMQLCYNPLTPEEIKYYSENRCKPVFNFHGVPPEDICLLDIFPEDTHIQGWTRLVELGIPGRVDLEWKLDNSAPTVFFTQSFCNKELMGKYLAEKYNGLHVDGHGKLSASVSSKLEAFLKLKFRNYKGNNT